MESSSRLAEGTAFATGVTDWGHRLQRRPIAGTVGGTGHHGVHPHSSQAANQHARQETNMVASGDFVHHGDHLICPQGKILRRDAHHKRQRAYLYVARQKDCQACPIKETCLPPGQKRRFFNVTIYLSVYSRARERNRTAQYQRERFRRRTIAEGAFASLDRLEWDKSRLRGLWKVDCEGSMAFLAHNALKMARRLGRGAGLLDQRRPPPRLEQTKRAPRPTR